MGFSYPPGDLDKSLKIFPIKDLRGSLVTIESCTARPVSFDTLREAAAAAAAAAGSKVPRRRII